MSVSNEAGQFNVKTGTHVSNTFSGIGEVSVPNLGAELITNAETIDAALAEKLTKAMTDFGNMYIDREDAFKIQMVNEMVSNVSKVISTPTTPFVFDKRGISMLLGMTDLSQTDQDKHCTALTAQKIKGCLIMPHEYLYKTTKGKSDGSTDQKDATKKV